MNSVLIAEVILGIGFLIFLILVLRSHWNTRKKHIEDYEKGRDKLTFRKKEKKKPVLKEGGGGFSGGFLGNIIGGFVTILIGVSLLPTIAEEVNAAASSSELTSSAQQMLSLCPIFFAIAVFAVGISVLYGSLRGTGLI